MAFHKPKNSTLSYRYQHLADEISPEQKQWFFLQGIWLRRTHVSPPASFEDDNKIQSMLRHEESEQRNLQR